jgi:hypothetical protein
MIPSPPSRGGYFLFGPTFYPRVAFLIFKISTPEEDSA